MKLDILAFGAHPDDVELSCSGTLLVEKNNGKKTGIIDLSRGELGTRGSKELRSKEAEKASEILGISARENLEIPDGNIAYTEENINKVIVMIRKYQPEIVLCNALTDRHPDHGNAAKLVADACFYSGLSKKTSHYHGQLQSAWRPKTVYHYIQDKYLKPDVLVDISSFFEKRMESVMAYSSQFYDKNSNEPETPISSQQFLDQLKLRYSAWGRTIGVEYAEGFIAAREIGVKSLSGLV